MTRTTSTILSSAERVEPRSSSGLSGLGFASVPQPGTASVLCCTTGIHHFVAELKLKTETPRLLLCTHGLRELVSASSRNRHPSCRRTAAEHLDCVLRLLGPATLHHNKNVYHSVQELHLWNLHCPRNCLDGRHLALLRTWHIDDSVGDTLRDAFLGKGLKPLLLFLPRPVVR